MQRPPLQRPQVPLRLLSRTPARLLAATMAIALAAGVALTATAQPMDGGPGVMRGAGMMMGGPHLERMLDSVNASADQRAQIKQITQSAHADLKAQRDAGRGLQEQTQALFAQPTVDARAAEALRAQMVAQHDAASKRMLQAMLDISRVLTPEQRKLIADRMAQRRSLMQRQRGEREALDKATP